MLNSPFKWWVYWKKKKEFLCDSCEWWNFSGSDQMYANWICDARNEFYFSLLLLNNNTLFSSSCFWALCTANTDNEMEWPLFALLKIPLLIDWTARGENWIMFMFARNNWIPDTNLILEENHLNLRVPSNFNFKLPLQVF